MLYVVERTGVRLQGRELLATIELVDGAAVVTYEKGWQDGPLDRQQLGRDGERVSLQDGDEFMQAVRRHFGNSSRVFVTDDLAAVTGAVA